MIFLVLKLFSFFNPVLTISELIVIGLVVLTSGLIKCYIEISPTKTFNNAAKMRMDSATLNVVAKIDPPSVGYIKVS